MSVRSLTTLAVERDRAEPAGPVAGGGRTAANAPDGTVPQGFADVLISAIPTEPLAAYTALVGVAVGAVDVAHPRAYLPFRWWCFAGFVVLTILAVYASYLRNLKAPSTGAPPPPKATHRRFPLAEVIAASIAAAAWGLVMPGSPHNVQMSGTARTLAVSTIAIAAAAILTLLSAPQLKSGTSKTAASPAPARTKTATPEMEVAG